MAGHEVARFYCGLEEHDSGNYEKTLKHLKIAASTGQYHAMDELRHLFETGVVSRESIDSTLTAYNNSCAEMRSESRDAYIHAMNGKM